MRIRRMFGVLVALLAVGITSDLIACGDKFLVAGRGTRYQRPKTARAASVLIYADPRRRLRPPSRKRKSNHCSSSKGIAPPGCNRSRSFQPSCRAAATT